MHGAYGEMGDYVYQDAPFESIGCPTVKQGTVLREMFNRSTSEALNT